MVNAALDVSREQIAAFCRKHHIRRLSFFGSVVRDDFGPESDVDCLVEFERTYQPGWEIVDIEEDFSKLVGGRPVQFVNPRFLNRHLEDRILGEAELQYEEG